MKCKDSQIKVPWGHIAVKLWGEETDDPVLVFHGILDNVGAFDRLIQLLPKTFYYICVDLPGHGRSSHWPAYALINTLDNLLVYKAIVDHFNRGKYIIIGHSYGGQLGIIFTQIYPEYVTKLIMLDTIYMYPHPTSNLKEDLRELHRNYFKTMEKLETRSPPTYTYEEALYKLMFNRRYGEIPKESAVPLLNRLMISTEDGKMRFSTDQRLKFFFNPPFNFKYIVDFIKKSPVLCPVLILLASDSLIQQAYFKKVLNLLVSYENVQIKVVEGNHDVHNAHPERVASLMTKFLFKQNAKM